MLPNRPHIMPIGSAKFGPVPHCMDGTIARARIPNIPNLIITSEANKSSGRSKAFAAMQIAIKSTVIISLGRPNIFKYFLITSIILYGLLTLQLSIFSCHH